MRAVLALVLVLGLSACSDDGQRRTAGPVGTSATVIDGPLSTQLPPASERATTPLASASGTPSPTSTLPSKGRARDGDVDGDGKVDRVVVGAEQVRVTLSGSGQTVQSRIESNDPSVAGVVDVDLDGRAEVFLEVDRGASTAFLLVLRYAGTRLAPLRVDEQPYFLLGVGGTATHGDGFSCLASGRLVVRKAQSDDGTTYRVTSTTYRVSGHMFVREGGSSATAASAEDERVRAAYDVDCGSVEAGG